ncbi:MAG: NAD(P)-dependent oxidoreductase [Minisyncoccia bacterium]
MQKKTIFITGGAGYVGAMLCDQFSKREDVEKIITVDKEPETDLTKGNTKIVYIHQNLADDGWQEKVQEYKPSVVIHTAWQIREIYGNRPLSWKWNIESSDKVFDFAFSHEYVDRLVYFSTVASYGAFANNTLEHRFTEEEIFRKTNYLYAEEKRITEERLHDKYLKLKSEDKKLPQVSIIRPAAITGPRGRYTRIRFGLQSALSGQLKGNFLYSVVSTLTSFVPVNKKWLRQYVHEDDITDIVELLSFESTHHEYEVFNIAPPGDVVLGKDMAKAVGKRTIPIHPYLVRIAFFIFWHLTRGKIPTAEGSWKGYSYPIAVDGSKITRLYGYSYKMPSKEAFVKNEGRYKVAR